MKELFHHLSLDVSTTVGTPMVFLIQTSQNCGSKVVHHNFDKLKSSSSTRNTFLELADRSSEKVAIYNGEFYELSQNCLVKKLKTKNESVVSY